MRYKIETDMKEEKNIKTTNLIFHGFFPHGFITMKNKFLPSHERIVSYMGMSILYEYAYIY